MAGKGSQGSTSGSRGSGVQVDKGVATTLLGVGATIAVQALNSEEVRKTAGDVAKRMSKLVRGRRELERCCEVARERARGAAAVARRDRGVDGWREQTMGQVEALGKDLLGDILTSVKDEQRQEVLSAFTNAYMHGSAEA